MKIKRLLFTAMFLLFASMASFAQKPAIKSNLLYDVTTTINLGVEFGLAQKWSLDLSANYNPWTFKENKKWKHLFMQPELRYWFCEYLNGSFIGFHLHGGIYNVGGVKDNTGMFKKVFPDLEKYRYEGWFVGAGVGFGHSIVLNRHMNLELEVGLGYAYTTADKFDCPTCGEFQSTESSSYLGVTKAAVSLVYVF